MSHCWKSHVTTHVLCFKLFSCWSVTVCVLCLFLAVARVNLCLWLWHIKIILNWAVTYGFQRYGILTSVDSDEPVKPPFKLRHSKWCSIPSIVKRLAKALVRLRVCTGWSEALLVPHTTLLEISYLGWIVFNINVDRKPWHQTSISKNILVRPFPFVVT